MKIDISKLSASDLDQLISEASKRRANMQPEHPREAPKTVEAVVNPAWFISPVKDGAAFQIRHPGFGWLAFVIPPPERVHLMTLLLSQSILANPNNTESTTAPATPISGGGGMVH